MLVIPSFLYMKHKTWYQYLCAFSSTVSPPIFQQNVIVMYPNLLCPFKQCEQYEHHPLDATRGCKPSQLPLYTFAYIIRRTGDTIELGTLFIYTLLELPIPQPQPGVQGNNEILSGCSYIQVKRDPKSSKVLPQFAMYFLEKEQTTGTQVVTRVLDFTKIPYYCYILRTPIASVNSPYLPTATHRKFQNIRRCFSGDSTVSVKSPLCIVRKRDPSLTESLGLPEVPDKFQNAVYLPRSIAMALKTTH